MSFNQFLVILRARWLIAVSVFLIVVVLDSVRELHLAETIHGDSFGRHRQQERSGDRGWAGDPRAGSRRPTYVDTEADIIASERVAQRVVKTLKLDQQPEARKLWAKGPNDDISVAIADLLLQAEAAKLRLLTIARRMPAT